MKKLLCSFLFTVLFLSVSAHAAEDSMDHFVRTKEYTGQFSDLTEDSTFYENVTALYEYGLSVGKTDGTFGLQDHLTVSQTVIFAGRIRSLYRTGDAELGAASYKTEEPQPACMPYLNYLKAEGVLGNELDEVLFTSATRGQMAHILAALLPEEALPLINDEIITEAYTTQKFVIDVTEQTPYQQEILYLYRCGISHGSDDKGSFHPEAPITRGAVAAMLTRMADPSLRITLVWKSPDVPDISAVTYSDLITPGEYIRSPQTQEEMDASVRHMLQENRDSLSLSYSDLTAETARDIALQALMAAKSHCEQGYNAASYELYGDTITVRFSVSSTEQSAATYREESLKAAKKIHDGLWRDGYITANMTQYQKALVYYTWICAHCEYDFSADRTSPSHLPYNPLVNGIASCDGYTSAYNLLLRLEGIDCYAYLTETHAWTIATLDGTECHIDTTWGDVGEGADITFFAMAPEFSIEVHERHLAE